MKEKNESEVILRSEDFQEVLTTIPRGIFRWGILTIAIIIALLLIGCAFIKYPETITATVQLVGEQPAATIIAHSSGKLQNLFVNDNQQVKKGAYLAVIENEAQLEDVAYLQKILDEQQLGSTDSLKLPRQNVILGNMQPLYSSYYIALETYKQFCKFDYYRTKIDLMKQRIEGNKRYLCSMLKQKDVTKEQMLISQKQYLRDSLLYARGLIAEVTLESTYSQYLQTLLSYENTQTNLENQQLQIASLYENLYDTKYQYADKKKNLELQLQSLVMQLQTEIKNWEMNYVLKSPIDGTVSFTNYWIENQNITAGEEAFSVIPNKNKDLFVKALLPIKKSGKVKVGQQVNIHFSNFPDTEFGVVHGIVRNISLVPIKVDQKSNYVLEILLPKGLYTTYGKQLPFVSGMEGEADIITESISILKRFLFPMRKLVNQNFDSYLEQ